MKFFVLLLLITTTGCTTLQSGAKTATSSIHDIYVLTEYKGENVNKILEKQATLEINLSKMTMLGNEGCNDFGGKIIDHNADKNTLVFGDINATEMYCNEMSNKIGNALYKVKKYKREGMILHLLSEKEEVLLTYKKVD
jgi:heat shock protein HslJ